MAGRLARERAAIPVGGAAAGAVQPGRRAGSRPAGTTRLRTDWRKEEREATLVLRLVDECTYRLGDRADGRSRTGRAPPARRWSPLRAPRNGCGRWNGV